MAQYRSLVACAQRGNEGRTLLRVRRQPDESTQLRNRHAQARRGPVRLDTWDAHEVRPSDIGARALGASDGLRMQLGTLAATHRPQS